VPSKILRGIINQNIPTIATFQKISIFREEERLTETESMTIQKIIIHSRSLSKYIIYSRERSVLRIFAWMFTPYSIPFGVKNSSFKPSLAGQISKILSRRSIFLSISLSVSTLYKSEKDIRVKKVGGIKLIKISFEFF